MWRHAKSLLLNGAVRAALACYAGAALVTAWLIALVEDGERRRRPLSPEEASIDATTWVCPHCADRGQFYRLIYRAPAGELRCTVCKKVFKLSRRRRHVDNAPVA